MDNLDVNKERKDPNEVLEDAQIRIQENNYSEALSIIEQFLNETQNNPNVKIEINELAVYNQKNIFSFNL